MKRILFVSACLMMIGMAACKKSTGYSTSCTFDACARPAPDSEVVRIQNYLSANNITAVKHCSGLYYQVVSEGSGPQPVACSYVTVNYTGTFTNGTVFDKSTAPVSFSLLQVIDGWTRGVPLMKKGGKIRLIIPPALAYGYKDYNGIPGNSILVFDIELVDVQ